MRRSLRNTQILIPFDIVKWQKGFVHILCKRPRSLGKDFDVNLFYGMQVVFEVMTFQGYFAKITPRT